MVVVYRQQPDTCRSLQTLLAATIPTLVPGSGIRLGILVADNTPGGQAVAPLPAGVTYRAYPDNPGLARPYNDALLQAEAQGYCWILTLDQDTSLPESFLLDMAAIARRYAAQTNVATIVPRIVDQKRLVSPFRFLGGWLPRVLPADADGVVGSHISALNSASLLRVSALREVGGYDEHFPLHNSDTRLYGLLDAAGKHVAVAGSVIVPHELSILDRQGRMSPERYRQMLEDECAFWDIHMGHLGRLERLLRLALRYGVSLFKAENKAFRRITLAELRRRITSFRKQRIDRTQNFNS